MARDSEDSRDEDKPLAPSRYGVPTKIDRRVLPLLRQLKEWSGIKQYRMVMLLVVNEVRSHPELVAALPPAVREGLESLEYDLGPDMVLYNRWRDQSEANRKGKKKS